MKTQVVVKFSLGAYDVIFEKYFQLPAAPFYDMTLYDEYKGNDIHVQFSNDDFQKTEIAFFVKNDSYYVEIIIKKLSSYFLNEQYNHFIKCGWTLYKGSEENLKKMTELLEKK
jgi:hypothetical protein